MLPIAIKLANEVIAFAPTAIQAGLDFWGVVRQSQAMLAEVAAPGNPEWDAADAGVKALIARAMDPATDDK